MKYEVVASVRCSGAVTAVIARIPVMNTSPCPAPARTEETMSTGSEPARSAATRAPMLTIIVTVPPMMSGRSLSARKISCALAEAPKRRNTTVPVTAVEVTCRVWPMKLGAIAEYSPHTANPVIAPGEAARNIRFAEAGIPGSCSRRAPRLPRAGPPRPVADEQQRGPGDDEHDRVDEERREEGAGGEAGEQPGGQDAQPQPAHVCCRRERSGQALAAGRGVLEHGDGGRGRENPGGESGQDAPG